MAKKQAAVPALTFEQALSELQTIVSRMEQNEATLEQSLQDYERGTELTALCQKHLSEAELRVQQVASKNSTLSLTDFTEAAHENAS